MTKGKFSLSRPLQTVTLISVLALVKLAAAQNNTTLGSPPWQGASVWPDRVIQNFSEDPLRSITVTWRTDSSVHSTIAQIAPATADARFDVASETPTPYTHNTL